MVLFRGQVDGGGPPGAFSVEDVGYLMTGAKRWSMARWREVARTFGGLLALALGVFAVVLLAFRKNPRAYLDILSSTLGSAYGISETLVTMTPLLSRRSPWPCPRASG